MTSEVCPFCGKTYKRLKSHLPHCKEAAKFKASQTEHPDRTDQTTPQLVAGSSGPTAKAEKASPTSVAAKKSATAGSAPPHSSSPTKSVKSADASPPSSLSPTSPPPPPMKKKKQKLSEQIKMATAPASSTSLTSFPELSLSSTIPKPKKKSLRTAKEEAKSDHVVQGPLDGTRSAPGDLQTGSNPSLTDPPESRAKAEKETSVIPDRASLTPLPSDKPKDVPQRKTSKTKSSGQTPPTTNNHEFLDSDINKSSTTPRETDDFWLDNLSEEKTFLKSGGADQARITIQGVKATLGRAKTSSRSNGSIILSQIETSDNPSRKTQLDNSVSLVTAPAGNKKDVVRNSVTTKTQSDQLPSLTTQQPKPRSIIKTDLKPKQVALIPLHHEGSSQPKPTVPAPVGHLLPISVSEGLKVGRHVTELPSISPSRIQFSSPHLAQALPARVEPLTTDDELRLEDRKRAAAHSYCEGAVARRRLGQVRLRELPEWLACKTPGHPREVVEMARQGWHWYYRRYIDVKKGGVGGLGMLLAGYCMLSYIWNYPHIKRDRWRKYH